MVDYISGLNSLFLSVNNPNCGEHFLVSGLILFLLLVLASGVLADEMQTETWDALVNGFPHHHEEGLLQLTAPLRRGMIPEENEVHR